MQFDGVDDEPYKVLRGRPLLAEKLEAIRVCGENGIGVTLVPTVAPKVNDDQIGAIIKFGIEHSPAVRGVHFQPISYFGRYPEPPADENRITLPEIIFLHRISDRGADQTNGSRAFRLRPSALRLPRRLRDHAGQADFSYSENQQRNGMLLWVPAEKRDRTVEEKPCETETSSLAGGNATSIWRRKPLRSASLQTPAAVDPTRLQDLKKSWISTPSWQGSPRAGLP